jgi:hypothetical protein
MSDEQTNKLSFHGANYVLTTGYAGDDVLRVEAETEDGADRWIGEFSAQCKLCSADYALAPRSNALKSAQTSIVVLQM